MTFCGQLLSTSVAGVYLTTHDFETVVHGIRCALSELADPQPPRSWRAPPVIARSLIEKVGYHESFPHLLGRIYTRSQADQMDESDLVLLPAACYSAYPEFAGLRLAGPTSVSVEATCFRQEESAEPGRLRSFRMREFVWLGGAGEGRAWRDHQLAGARAWLAELGLEPSRVVASDPFFGSGSRLRQNLQIDQELKIELAAPVAAGLNQALASGNYHKDQFGRLFAIRDSAGEVAHSACMAFGYERVALALFHRHGPDPRRWPEHVRKILNEEGAR
jgi:seryl-tRNA synthetase